MNKTSQANSLIEEHCNIHVHVGSDVEYFNWYFFTLEASRMLSNVSTVDKMHTIEVPVFIIVRELVKEHLLYCYIES